jgi:hypothetical protein
MMNFEPRILGGGYIYINIVTQGGSNTYANFGSTIQGAIQWASQKSLEFDIV